MFPWIYTRTFNQRYAKLLWDSLIQLRIKCPTIANLNIAIDYVESILKKFEHIDGFQELDEEAKSEIKMTGDLPDHVAEHLRKKKGAKVKQGMTIDQANKEAREENLKAKWEAKENDPEYIRKQEARRERRERK